MCFVCLRGSLFACVVVVFLIVSYCVVHSTQCSVCLFAMFVCFVGWVVVCLFICLFVVACKLVGLCLFSLLSVLGLRFWLPVTA